MSHDNLIIFAGNFSPTTQLTFMVFCKFRLIGRSEYASWCWNIARKQSRGWNCSVASTRKVCSRNTYNSKKAAPNTHDPWRYSTIKAGQSYVGASFDVSIKILRKSSKACWSRLSSHLGIVYAFLYLSVPSSCAILGLYVCHRSLDGSVLFSNFLF